MNFPGQKRGLPKKKVQSERNHFSLFLRILFPNREPAIPIAAKGRESPSGVEGVGVGVGVVGTVVVGMVVTSVGTCISTAVVGVVSTGLKTTSSTLSI